MLPVSSFAHEVYVLNKENFDKGIHAYADKNPLLYLADKDHLGMSLFIALGILLIYASVFLWSITNYAYRLDKIIKKAKPFGFLIIRLTIAVSFFFAANNNSMFGPELSLNTVWGGEIIKISLYVISIFILIGLFTELAAFAALILFTYLFLHFGIYMTTYLDYLGIIIVLLLFGSGFISLDRFLFGNQMLIKFFGKYKFLETPIIRIFFGISLVYAAYSVKILHPILPIEVYNQHHLAKYFFNLPAYFVAAGAGAIELTIGILIIIGLQTRLTIILSLIFISLSLLYFREMLWPHIVLYGISFSLLINSADRLTADYYLPSLIRSLIKKSFSSLRSS